MDELITKLFRKNRDTIFLQMFRYLFVGTASFLIDFIIYLSLINFLGQNYLISAAIAFFISVLGNYYMSTSWGFNQADRNNKVLDFNLFILISFIGLIFTEILLYLFVDYGNINYIWSKIIASFIVMFWNFTARRIMFYGKKI